MKIKKRTQRNTRKKPLSHKKHSSSASGFKRSSNPLSDDSGEVKRRMNAEELKNFLLKAKSEHDVEQAKLEKDLPVFEIHSEGQIQTMRPERYLSNAADFAGDMVAKAIKKESEEIEFLPNFDIFVEMGLTIRNLRKVKLFKSDNDKWCVRFIYPDKKVDDGYVNFELPEMFGGHDIKQAEQFLVMALAHLIVRDGETNPENSIQERTFVFDKAALWVDERMYGFTKQTIAKAGTGIMTLENTNLIFQQVADQLGGTVTDENLKTLSPMEFKKVMAGVTYTLLRGVNKWPFK